MLNEKDFDISGEDKYLSDNSNQERFSSKKKDFDFSRINEFANNHLKEFRNAVRTGNTKSLEALVNVPLFSKEFSDKRNFFVKIKDTTKSYLANLKNAEYLVKSGKYQAIESEIKNLSSKNDLITKYRSDHESAKAVMIRKLDDYSLEISKLLDVVTQKESELLNLKQIFTDDAVELLNNYSSGEISLNDLSNKGLNTDAQSIQAYKFGVAKLQVTESELNRTKMSLDTLNTEYEIMLDKKSGVELDLIDIDLQELYNNALINQLTVDLKLSSRPPIYSMFAGLKLIRDNAHSLSDSLIDSDIKKRDEYNAAAKKAGYDSSFRKQYARKQKKRSRFKF